MDYSRIDINTDSINHSDYRNTDHLLQTDPPARSCLSRIARTFVGQHIAGDMAKGASGTINLIGAILFSVGTVEKGPTDPGTLLGAGIVGMGLTIWSGSTALSASIRPERETLCLHLGKSALTHLVGCCICCLIFCQ